MVSRPTLDALGFNKAARRIHGNRRLNVVGDWSDFFDNLGDEATAALHTAAPALIDDALGIPRPVTTPTGVRYTTSPTGQVVLASPASTSAASASWMVPALIGVGILALVMMKK